MEDVAQNIMPTAKIILEWAKLRSIFLGNQQTRHLSKKRTNSIQIEERSSNYSTQTWSHIQENPIVFCPKSSAKQLQSKNGDTNQCAKFY